MLAIRNVSKTYSNGVQALRDVSLDVPPGMSVEDGSGRRGQGDIAADERLDGRGRVRADG